MKRALGYILMAVGLAGVMWGGGIHLIGGNTNQEFQGLSPMAAGLAGAAVAVVGFGMSRQ